MATFLDITTFKYFGIIFTFLLVFIITYGLLTYMKIFGEGTSQGINAVIALCLAFLLILYRPAVDMVNYLTPWFLVFILLIFFILFIVRMVGVGETDLVHAIKSNTTLYTWIIVVSVFILIFTLGGVFGQSFLERGPGGVTGDSPGDSGATIQPGNTTTDGTSYSQNVLNTLFHPKVLGIIFVLLMAVFTILFITRAR